MIKRLTRHGNSHALVIEKPILDLLGINPETPLSVTTNGRCLVVSPAGDSKSRKTFRKALEKVNKKFGPALRRLAG